MPEVLPDAGVRQFQAAKEQEAEKADLACECLRDDPVKETSKQ